MRSCCFFFLLIYYWTQYPLHKTWCMENFFLFTLLMLQYWKSLLLQSTISQSFFCCRCFSWWLKTKYIANVCFDFCCSCNSKREKPRLSLLFQITTTKNRFGFWYLVTGWCNMIQMFIFVSHALHANVNYPNRYCKYIIEDILCIVCSQRSGKITVIFFHIFDTKYLMHGNRQTPFFFYKSKQ